MIAPALCALAVSVLAVGRIVLRSDHAGPAAVAVDLVNALPSAIDRRPAATTFSVRTVTIGGTTERAIVADTPSRMILRASLPRRPELRFRIGIVPSDDTAPGSVLFVVLVGTEGSPGVDNLFQRVIDPSTESGGNRWQDVAVDLSPFAGQTIDFVFNTRSAAPAGAPAPRGAWGALQVVSRQLP